MGYAKGASGFVNLKSKLKSRGDSFKLKAHRTYIFPTGFGIAYAVLSFILLVMAIGYGNNIQYFFVFLLVSMGMTTSWATNRNVDAVRILDANSSSLFANELNNLQLKIKNQLVGVTKLWNLEFKIAESSVKEFQLVAEVDRESEVVIKWVPKSRGKQFSPRIMIQSVFPFEILRSWRYHESEHELLVYPERKGRLSLQALIASQADKDAADFQDTEGLFRDFREFQNSDPPNRIDWRRSIRHQKILVKNYEKSGERKILIDWDMTEGVPSFEDRISQLSFWIDQCYQNNEIYALKIKNFKTEYSSSSPHYKRCMEKLALLQISETV